MSHRARRGIRKEKKETKILVHLKEKTCRMVNSNSCSKTKFSTKLSIKLVSPQNPSKISHFAEVS
jgi:hypothetical protein